MASLKNCESASILYAPPKMSPCALKAAMFTKTPKPAKNGSQRSAGGVSDPSPRLWQNRATMSRS